MDKRNDLQYFKTIYVWRLENGSPTSFQVNKRNEERKK
jgi:hypothetical protein